MKKTFIYMLSFLMLGLVSCTEDFNKDIAAPQTNEQEDAKNADFQVALGSGLASPLVLSDLPEGASVNAITVSSTPQLEEGATLSYALQVSKTKEFETAIDLPSTSNDKSVSVSAANLDQIVKSLFGKAPNPNELYIRTYVYIHEGTSAVRSTANVVGPAIVTPIGQPIEPAYYLIGDMNGWNAETVIKFNHSGNDVYEDPHFSVILEVGANTYFKIAPQSAVDAQAAGGDFWGAVIGTAVDGDASLEGSIVTQNSGAIKIENAGFVKISLNMLEYTYKIEPFDMNPILYVPGNHQGWSPDVAPTLYSGNMDMIYDGFVYLDGEYKFTSAPNWDNTNYGNGGDGKLSTDGGAGNLNAETGFYYLKANLNALTYEQTKTEWGLIGDATPGGWDSSTPMAYDRATNTWAVEATLEGGKELKFRANNEWTLNLGGALNNLTFGGDNIKIETSGTYSIELRLTNALDGYSCSISKK